MRLSRGVVLPRVATRPLVSEASDRHGNLVDSMPSRETEYGGG